MNDPKDPKTPKAPNPRAFGDVEPKHRRGIKISNDTSTVPKPPPDTSVAFQEKATAVFGKFEEYKARGWELASTFKKMVDDTILAANKTVISKDVEQEVVNKLVALAIDMNEDNDQPQGIGAVALCTTLMRVILSQRDKINMLTYRIENVEKRIASLAKTNEKE
jgi:hypothetical protein